MKTKFDKNELADEILSLGINISLLSSVVKCLNTSLDYEFNYKHNDIANLVMLLARLLGDTKDRIENIEKILSI